MIMAALAGGRPTGRGSYASRLSLRTVMMTSARSKNASMTSSLRS
jgi:hypothetical protein